MNNNTDILFEEISGHDGSLGLITLHRPSVLNALNHTMFIALDQQLAYWETAAHIKAVVIRASEGRAFCAGGDIRHAYQLGMAKDPNLLTFFTDEYNLNQRIHYFPKPYIALLNGITMGGGAGVSMHGSHRVATEKLIFAMPETSIGFFPDVGASYFLSRLPGKIGLFLGLTGERINYADCLAVGLATHVVSPDSLIDLVQSLAETSLKQNSDAVVSDVINHFSVPVEKSDLITHKNEIDFCFSKKSVEEIIDALEHYPDAWCEQMANVLNLKSPTSLKVALSQLQQGAKLSFEACMAMEKRLVKHFLQNRDFFEGVRAAIIDKDQMPVWQPGCLHEVTNEMVAQYFI